MFQGKKILVIGGTGTIGQGLVKELIKRNPKVIRIFSRDEYKQFKMEQELGRLENIRFLLGDVRDKERVQRAMEGIDIVFHLAALKHVPSCEYNPFEAVKTNVMGTQNVIESAIHHRVERVVYTSSDKAINPTNTMGATKLLAERLMSSADYYKGGKRPIFASVRFGNVMGSRGSVIPLFKTQILEKRKVTVTDPAMSRFMMSITEAVSLVLKAAEYAVGGDVFVLKMPVVNIKDLAEVVIEETCKKYDLPREEIKIEYIGLRPGEKMYEELMTKEEGERAEELEEMFRIYPITRAGINITGINGYSTDSSKVKALNKEEIRNLILREDLI
ncbi:MAG TPA: SDR family NAD(P)-dependent oxidoreductase [Defluviitaleaceae bacterium]|jgi:UDP-N-acetylglucosamine 4,6-dehydratase|nr:SDR family NAD(P)-dependent oxidoreductase [Candidatus Epulonipiscium sp.]HQD50398.1 SDR family NAD(P)-dependent oxidoreductase [Defluviitaleaceae bacterium]